MTFENEFVSEDDIKRYSLDELKARFNPWGWRLGRPVGFTHNWTIDRKQSCFLLFGQVVRDVGPSGMLEPTSKRLWVLDLQGRQVDILLELDNSSSKRISESPFLIRWNLLEIDSSLHPDVSEDLVTFTLKEALQVYGNEGAVYQVPNTVVCFNF